MSTTQFLTCGVDGVPGIRLRGVALFMNRDQERLGISFCIGSSRDEARINILPGLAALINGSTSKTSIKGSKYAALPQVEVASHRSRLMQSKGKTIALFELGELSPFAQACSLLQKVRKAGEYTAAAARIISVDAMVVRGERGDVADRFGCLKASEHQEVVVYEDRGKTYVYTQNTIKLIS